MRLCPKYQALYLSPPQIQTNDDAQRKEAAAAAGGDPLPKSGPPPLKRARPPSWRRQTSLARAPRDGGGGWRRRRQRRRRRRRWAHSNPCSRPRLWLETSAWAWGPSQRFGVGMGATSCLDWICYPSYPVALFRRMHSAAHTHTRHG